LAGLRQGLDDTRGTLFFDIARILDNKRPRHFLLENVKGLLSHNRGETFQTILKVLTDLGYDVEWEILNSKNFGVPQNRERVYIIGHLGGGSGRKIFPFQRDGAEINE
jgi:DNA (cytosine-5)-methyltransferase 1